MSLLKSGHLSIISSTIWSFYIIGINGIDNIQDFTNAIKMYSNENNIIHSFIIIENAFFRYEENQKSINQSINGII